MLVQEILIKFSISWINKMKLHLCWFNNSVCHLCLKGFKGSPLQYHSFFKSFESGVESKNESPSDRLYFLEQYTRGHPKEIVKSCQHMPADHGYLRAKALLQERFGDQYKIASAYMEKALSWANIKSEDL